VRILVAEDDSVSRLLLETHLKRWGHEPVVTKDGVEAWAVLQRDDAPPIAILDWMMPGMDGLEICRRARARSGAPPLYIILLTARVDPQDTIDGLGAGADDFVTKPFDAGELRARLGVGVRVAGLQLEVAARVAELERALARVDTLHGILPICSYCKKVRNDSDSWQQMEAYVSAHSAVRFNHGVCPDCVKDVLQPELEELRRARASRGTNKP
jgi:sigma-B regulation protein RsbU (phosphoserine phosphatase)